jgi:hypothetical protein
MVRREACRQFIIVENSSIYNVIVEQIPKFPILKPVWDGLGILAKSVAERLRRRFLSQIANINIGIHFKILNNKRRKTA